MSGFSIGARQVGGGAPCFIVAEVGLAHDGSLSQAHAYIDAVAKAGVDAVKFQCRIPGTETTPNEWRVKPKWPQDASRYDYWKRTAFTAEEWAGLSEHAHHRGIEFLCSPFSVEAVKLLDPMVKAWKVPSGEITNAALLDAIRDTNKRAILSTGLCTYFEANDAVRRLGGREWSRVLQCTSQYPCPPNRIGLEKGQDGLSDHSGSIYPSLAAVALGASIIEIHVCFSKQQFGFDVSSSITIEELAELVKGARIIHAALQPVDKDAMARELQPMRDLFMTRAEGFSFTDA